MNALKTWFIRLRNARRFHPTWIMLAVVLSLLYGVIMWVPADLLGKTSRTQPAPQPSTVNLEISTPANAVPKAAQADFLPSAEDDLPTGAFGASVRMGRNIFVDTQTYARRYVGNGLNCVNCHLDAGRKSGAAPLWAAYAMFPAYRDKNKKVNSYEDRIAGCFQFSMNGKAPAYNSPEMIALTSYSYWLAHGAPIGVELKGRGYPKLAPATSSPDVRRGKQVFAANCALCHGVDGQGTKAEDRYAFPPLWGEHSFNAGAGMMQLNNAAAFIKANMPLGKGGTLTEQEAWDVAKYMNSHARPAGPQIAKKMISAKA